MMAAKQNLMRLDDWRNQVFISPDQTLLERQRTSARITRAANRSRETFLASQPVQPGNPPDSAPRAKQVEAIQQRDVGRVIGRNGGTITMLRTKYSCTVSISRSPNANGLVDVTVEGTHSSRNACVDEIRRHLVKCHAYIDTPRPAATEPGVLRPATGHNDYLTTMPHHLNSLSPGISQIFHSWVSVSRHHGTAPHLKPSTHRPQTVLKVNEMGPTN